MSDAAPFADQHRAWPCGWAPPPRPSHWCSRARLVPANGEATDCPAPFSLDAVRDRRDQKIAADSGQRLRAVEGCRHRCKTDPRIQGWCVQTACPFSGCRQRMKMRSGIRPERGPDFGPSSACLLACALPSAFPPVLSGIAQIRTPDPSKPDTRPVRRHSRPPDWR